VAPAATCCTQRPVDQDAAGGVEREPVRFHTHRNLEGLPLGAWCRDRDAILASIGCEHESAGLRHKRTSHSSEVWKRFDVPISRSVDHVHCIIAGMCEVEPIRSLMDISVIKPALGPIWWELDMAE
jgi:hypothetical protein